MLQSGRATVVVSLVGHAEPTVSVVVVRGLVAALEQIGIAPLPLLRAGNVDPAWLATPDRRISRALLEQLVELALDHSADEALGLHWSDRLGAATFAPVSHLISSSTSLRHGLHTLDQFYRLLSDGDDYQLLEDGDQISLRVTVRFAAPRMQRFAVEMIVASFFRLIARFSAPRAPHWVGFEHAAPAHRDEYTRVFGQPVHFRQSFSGLVLERSLLDAASPQRDTDAHQALRTLAEQRLALLPAGATHAGRVREILIRACGPNRIDMARVADALGMSVRSLRRHLTAEGRSYSEIARDAAVHTAKQLLLDRRLTIQETAYEMGFSEIGSFYRAFKRWTGMTPHQFRA